MPQRTAPPKAEPATRPCGQDRPVTDIVGRANDLINCYLQDLGQWLQDWIPLAVIAGIVLVILIFAAREMLKG